MVYPLPHMEGKQSYHHGNLKRAVIAEALKIISSEGPEKLTLREIASRIGVTHAAPYRHFPNKASLLTEVAEEGFVTLLKKMQKTASLIKKDPVEKLRAIGVTYIKFARSNTAHFRVMFGAHMQDKLKSAKLREVSLATLQYVAEIIEQGQKEGLIIDQPPRKLAVTAWSLVHGLAALLVEGHLSSPDAPLKNSTVTNMTETAIDTLIHGIKTH